MSLSLVIMAAGMASRYGSLKQVEAFGPSGETLMEYSLYNAIQAGFDKMVFIVRRNMEYEPEQIFRSRLPKNIKIDFAFQELDVLPKGFQVPDDRIKPWGTGHAVLAAGGKVNEPFAVINADDFYGQESFVLLANHLKKIPSENLAVRVIGYRLSNTLSGYGSVSRAICETTPDGYLQTLTERTRISREKDGNIYAYEKEERIRLTGNELVSMNLLGFTPPFFKVLKDGFLQFLQSHPDNKSEYYLPNAITQMVSRKNVKVPVLETHDKTFGVTYPEDKVKVKEMIGELISKGVYPKELWTKMRY